MSRMYNESVCYPTATRAPPLDPWCPSMNERPTVGAGLITRDDLTKLKPLLAQLTKLDQVVVVDAGSRDGTRGYVRELGPPFELHEFRWRPRPEHYGPHEWGFAAARNESFSYLNTNYLAWFDSDDTIVTVAEGRPLEAPAEAVVSGLQKLIADSPDVDVFLMDYLYMTDEFGNPTSVIGKERLLKREVGWRWRHPIHEILVPQAKAVADVQAVGVRDMAVAH